MKKSLTLLSILFFTIFFFLPVGTAHAITVGFVDLFTVDSPVSTTPKNFFGPGEEPFLYMNVAIPDGTIANTISGWNDPDGLGYFSNSELSTNTERWASLSDWNSVEKVGTWTVHANYFDSAANNIVESTNFTVTPEPATMSLFLLGGIPMMLRRKKTNQIFK